MILFRLALRNIWVHRVRTLIVGGLICFGTVLLITGNAVLDGIADGVERAIVYSISGHLQVYSEDAKDELALFGQPGGLEQDIGRIDDIGVVREALLTIDNVGEVIPQGTNYSIVFGKNPLDKRLAELRTALTAGDMGAARPTARHVRQILTWLSEEMSGQTAAKQLDTADAKDLELLAEATTDAFWAGFEAAPMATLETLENKVAPMSRQQSLVWLRYLGTDPKKHREVFDLFEIVKGEAIPDGQRGILLNELFYELRIKHRIASRLDIIHRSRSETDRTLANDAGLRNRVRHNVSQYQQITWELSPADVPEVARAIRPEVERMADEVEGEISAMFGEAYAAEVRAYMDENWGLTKPADAGPEDVDIGGLMRGFLRMTDEDFDRRYALFYEAIAPRIQLYLYPVGSDLALTAFTRAGYVTSVNAKIWGTFRIKSLEDSAFAGMVNVIDLVTFRDLYGFSTPEQEAEIAQIQKDADVEVVSRGDAEEALFGGDEVEESDTDWDIFGEIETAELGGKRAEALEAQQRGYERSDLENGPAVHAAVLLKDPSRLDETRALIQQVSDERGLGLQTATWQDASGLVGQFTFTVRAVLNVAIGIIFLVALVIINNSMVMATMERVKEIGTMRAIGAQQAFITQMFLVEALVLAVLFGGLGALLGAGAVGALGAIGIPAFHEALVLLFAGPRLYPSLTAMHMIVAVSVILVVALLSTFYPALLATRIQPVTAMQVKD